MSYTIKIKTKEQFLYLQRIVVNSQVMMHKNTSAYVEYLDMIDALAEIFAEVVIEKDPVEDLPPAPTKKKPKPKSIKLSSFCKDHATYGAKRAPRTACETCWAAYKRLNPMQYPTARRNFDRTQRTKDASS